MTQQSCDNIISEMSLVLALCSYLWHAGHLLPVPSSKGDVFRSRALSPTDKRVLMRFLKACGDAMEGRGHLKVDGVCRLFQINEPSFRHSARCAALH